MGNMSFDIEGVNAATATLNKNQADLSDLKSKFQNEYSSVNYLLGDVISAISSDMSKLSSMIGGVSKTISNQTNKIYDFDLRLANLASKIAIPTNFLANNSMAVNSYNNTLLKLIDGKSVNMGQGPGEVKGTDDSTVTAVPLKNIAKEQTVEQKYDDSSTIVGQTILGNINNNVTEEQTYDETSSIQKQIVNDINNDKQTEEKNLDATSMIQRENMQNINNNSNSNINETKDSSIIGKTVLGNINGNVDKNAVKLDGITNSKPLAGTDNLSLNDISLNDVGINKINSDVTGINDSVTNNAKIDNIGTISSNNNENTQNISTNIE